VVERFVFGIGVVRGVGEGVGLHFAGYGEPDAECAVGNE
jgi:hypothetical protein